jgi:hypothetical protein
MAMYPSPTATPWVTWIKSLVVLKGEHILAQWQRLGIISMEIIVGLKVQYNLSCPYQGEKNNSNFFAQGDIPFCYWAELIRTFSRFRQINGYSFFYFFSVRFTHGYSNFTPFGVLGTKKDTH